MEVGDQSANAAESPVEGQRDVSQGTGDQPSADDVIRRETHQRVLGESKQFKQRAIAAEERLKSIEDEALKLQNNHQERADRYKADLEKALAEKSALVRRVTLEPALRAAGCVDVATAIQIGNEALLMEDGGNLAGVDDFLADLQKSKPYLFTSQTPSSVNASVPSGGLKVEAPTTDLSKLSVDEIKDRLKALK